MYKLTGTTLVISLALSVSATALSFSGGDSGSGGGSHEDSAHNGSNVTHAERIRINSLNALRAEAQSKEELLKQSVVEVETFDEQVAVKPVEDEGTPADSTLVIATAVTPPSNAAPIAATQTFASQTNVVERNDPDLGAASTTVVPLPAAGLALLMGLAGLGAAARKKAKYL